MDVVDKIAAVPTDWNDKPKTPVKMKTVEIIEAEPALQKSFPPLGGKLFLS